MTAHEEAAAGVGAREAASAGASAREAILARVRAATADVPADEPAAWELERDSDAASAYARRRDEPLSARAARFAARVREHGARVAEAADDPAAIAAAVGEACAALGIGAAVVPPDLPAAWTPAGLRRVADDPPLDPAALSAADGVLTGAALGIADTGTIALDAGPAQGRRALTLVPDTHVCVVRASQLAGGVPEALERLAGAARAGRPITLVSGPSATSDIGFERVVGVHGPRTLHVVLVRDEPPASG